MSFETRINKSKDAIKRFIEYAKEKQLDYAYSGYEELKSSPEFQDKIRKIDDITAKRIRYFPDMILVGKKTWLLEIKHGKTIEKDAYDTYMELHNLCWNVGIVFLNNDNLKFIRINDLMFILPKKYNIPIIDDYWIAPRKMDKERYYEWKKIYPNASGTTYAYIDFCNFLELGENG